MFGWLARLFGYGTTKPQSKPQRKQRQAVPVARYDAAQTTDDNRLHWANADGLSATAANSPEVRRVLRNRSRYEDDNNSNATGLLRSVEEETVGTGPRLQLVLRGPDADFETPLPPDLDRQIEDRWREWSRANNLPDSLRTTVGSEEREGEIFVFLHVNPASPDPVQLAVRLYEADQIDTPNLAANQPVSGIEFDQHGNPTFYHVLKQHPGDVGINWQWSAEYDRVPARQMIHLFNARRASQRRGVPTLTASLSEYAILRRYTNACLLGAEAQARVAGVIEQENDLGPGGDPDDDENDDVAARSQGEQIQYAGVHLLTLSAGQSAKALPHTTPPQNYAEFKAEILTDGGRPLRAPRNVSTGSSAEYNYSSGRLDQQQWHTSIKIRRERLERLVLDRIFREWVAMALLIPGYLPPGTPPLSQWRWRWRWDGFASIDPQKDASAATERLANGTSSLDRECGDLGEDWEEVQDQRLAEESREIRRRKELGLPPKGQQQPAKKPATVPAEAEEEQDA